VAVGAGGHLDQVAGPVVAAGAGRPAAGQVEDADLAVAGEAAGQRLAAAGAAQDQPLDLGLDDDGVEAGLGPRAAPDGELPPATPVFRASTGPPRPE
jgi:hypothetical protein